MRSSKRSVFQIVYIVALIAVLLPLFVVAPFDRPSADDWNYGKALWDVLAQNGNFLNVIKTCFGVVKDTYFSWEGRYSCVFFDSLMPGVWGEHVYGMTPFIMIFTLIFSEFILFDSLLGKDNRKYLIPILVPALIMQILYVPSIVEAFYWYTGAINYTFMHSLSFVFFTFFLMLHKGKKSSAKIIALLLAEILLAVIIGGANFSTSLYTVITAWIILVLFSICDRKISLRLVFPVLLLTAGFCVAILSPGNSMRINSNFGGATGGLFYAVFTSISKTCENILLWLTSWQFILVLLMIVPFASHAVKEMNWSFKLPGLFTAVSVGVFALQIFPTMYVDGTVGGGRQIALLIYSFWIWAVLNLLYWLGWIYKKTHFKIKNEKLLRAARCIYGNPGKTALVLAIICFLGMCITERIKTVTTTRAVKDIVTGSAVGYATEWDVRYEILHDDTQVNVSFTKLENRPETLFYADFEAEEPYTWVNHACASYYGKDSITLTFN